MSWQRVPVAQLANVWDPEFVGSESHMSVSCGACTRWLSDAPVLVLSLVAVSAVVLVFGAITLLGGNEFMLAYATEALWLFDKGGWKETHKGR